MCTVVLATLLSLPGTGVGGSQIASAQSDESVRSAARQLGTEGIALYEQGEYAAAADKLARAFEVMKVPTLGLWLARARAKKGELVEASELYLAVTRMTVEDDAPDVMKEAIVTAGTEYEELGKRIPNLTISLEEGEDAAGIAIRMDGNALRAQLLGVPIPVNPGKHYFEVTRGEKKLRGAVELVEGERKAIELTFRDKDPAPAPVPALHSNPAPRSIAPVMTPPAPLPEDDTRGHAGRAQRIGAFAAFGVGAAGFVAGGILGGVTLEKREDLDDTGDCIDTRCPTWLSDSVDEYNRVRTGSVVGFSVGGVGAVAGVVLLLTAPRRQNATRIEPWSAGSTVGVRGAF